MQYITNSPEETEKIGEALAKKLQPGDVIALCGKGHETYQEIRGVKHDFDEKIVVAELLAEIDAE